MSNLLYGTGRRTTFREGAFGAGGGRLINMYWEDDPELTAQALLNVAGGLEDTYKPLLASLEIARDDMEDRFRVERDPDGVEWAELNPDYLAYKISKGKDPGILKRDHDLMNAAPEGWKIIGDTLVYDASGLPEYGLLHQTGNDGENAGRAQEHREYVRSHRIAHSRHNLPAETYGHMNLGIGRGHALPARPFIGLSAEAYGKINLAFDTWFDITIETFYNPSVGRIGVVSERGAGGRFTKGGVSYL